MQVDRQAPLRFLKTAFLPDDWIAVLLKRHDTGEAVQRVGPVAMFLDDRFQGWLRFKNAHGFCVFVSVNALTPGRRSRTRNSVRAVRHVFLDADRDAGHVLGMIADRSDLPAPTYIVRSSKNRAHVLWRVDGMRFEQAETLQKQLSLQLNTDPAATSAAQMTRLPGLLNHKYSPPQWIDMDDRTHQPIYGARDFPHVAAAPSHRVAATTLRRTGNMPMPERARRYLAATPPAIQGQRGDSMTFRVCCRLLDRFSLTNEEVLILLADWNARCQPPWPESELTAKIRTARRRVESSRQCARIAHR